MHANCVPTTGPWTLVFHYRPAFSAAALAMWSFGTTAGTNTWQYCYVARDEPPASWNGLAIRQTDSSGEVETTKSTGWLSSQWYRCSLTWDGSTLVFKLGSEATLTNTPGGGTLDGSWTALGGATAHSSHTASQGEIGNVACFGFIASQSEIDSVAAPS